MVGVGAVLGALVGVTTVDTAMVVVAVGGVGLVEGELLFTAVCLETVLAPVLEAVLVAVLVVAVLVAVLVVAVDLESPLVPKATVEDVLMVAAVVVEIAVVLGLLGVAEALTVTRCASGTLEISVTGRASPWGMADVIRGVAVTMVVAEGEVVVVVVVQDGLDRGFGAVHITTGVVGVVVPAFPDAEGLDEVVAVASEWGLDRDVTGLTTMVVLPAPEVFDCTTVAVVVDVNGGAGVEVAVVLVIELVVVVVVVVDGVARMVVVVVDGAVDGALAACTVVLGRGNGDETTGLPLDRVGAFNLATRPLDFVGAGVVMVVVGVLVMVGVLVVVVVEVAVVVVVMEGVVVELSLVEVVVVNRGRVEFVVDVDNWVLAVGVEFDAGLDIRGGATTTPAVKGR